MKPLFGSKRKKIVFAFISASVIVSVSLFAVYYSGILDKTNAPTKEVQGPYVSLLAYGNNGTAVFPIKNNLSADLSVWIPSRTGNGMTLNLYNASVKWNQVIPAGQNFTIAVNSWQSFMKNRTSNPTMSLIVTHTSVNGSNLDVYEYYTNIAFNPFAGSIENQVFINNFTLNLEHPFAVIPVNTSNGTSGAISGDSPDKLIGPGGCPPGDTTISWTKTVRYTGWYPLNIINATNEPSNEELDLSWTSASFSAKFEFNGITSTNSNFLSSSNGYETPNLAFSAQSYSLTGNPAHYDILYLKDTTLTWSFGKEYFWESYDNGQYCELVGTAKVSNLKVQYSGATSTIAGGFLYSTTQASNTSTFGNAAFDQEWARATAYAFSNSHTVLDKQLNLSAGASTTVSRFDIQSTSNYNAIMNTIQAEGAIALGIASAGLVFAVLGAAASVFPGGATASTLAEIGVIAGIMGVADAVINLATSFTLVVYTSGNFQTMHAQNQIITESDPNSSITVDMYDTGGNTDFSSSSGTYSYIARTPYEKVEA